MTDTGEAAPRRMPWQGAGRDEPVYRQPMTLSLDDHMAVDGHRWLKERRGFIAVFLLIGFAVALFQGYDRLMAGDVFGFGLVVVVTLVVLALLAVPVHWLFARTMRWALESTLKRQGLLGKRFVLEVSRDGIRLEDEPASPGGDVVSSHFPWSAFRAIERDEERYLFWIELRRAIVLHRDGFASVEADEAFRGFVEAWSGRSVVSPPAFAKNRRGRNADWGREPAASADQRAS
ncbi:hypothetical protein E3C22_13075 [Jiella endophytica]|uniref:YcxB family protein n=1 Tax=Jiella endophytica TaxID=2558362 RepID=A0A4Y8RI05_9HYPH|nr:hypothetical protein [Jiella endophytica]TFF21624.1 hypothetical protein E3C22_13075 [Jiella endophytica]